MIKFTKGHMKKKLEETMAFLQSVDEERVKDAHEQNTNRNAKNS